MFLAATFLSSWERAQERRVGGEIGVRLDESVISWQKPEFGWSKMNIDAAKADSRGATGVV